MRIACFCLLAVIGLGATLAGANTLTYEHTWDASALPEDSTPAFEPRGDTSNYALITSGENAPYMKIDTPATFGDKTKPGAYADFSMYNNANVDFSAGGTVDFTMRVNGRSDPPDNNDQVCAFLIYAPDGSGGCYIYPGWAKEDAFASYEMDTSQWHDYRLVLESPGENATLFVDGQNVSSISGSLIATLDYNGFRFGDVSDSRSGDSDWKFIGWTSEVYVPEPTMLVSLCALGLFLLMGRRK